MSGQTHALLERLRAMETRVLLTRYRAGGLLPEAEASLLEVLAERGHIAEALERKGKEERDALPAIGLDRAHPVSRNGTRPPAIPWQWFEGKVAASALRAGDRTGIRAICTQAVRLGLLMVCGLSVSLTALVGLGGFVIFNVFCDQGPLAKCFFIGLVVLAVSAVVVLALALAILAVSSPTGRFAWYLKVFPLIPLPVFVAAIYWHATIPPLCTRVAVFSGLLMLFSGMHLLLSRGSLPPHLPGPGAN